ncbi:MAG: DUF2764 family protein [Rikenellaceae bacterium]
MFESQYYSLVAGLREYALDSEAKGFDAKAIVEEILAELSAKDAQVVRLLYTYYDCENIVACRASRGMHNPLGNLSREEIEEQLISPTLLPSKIAHVIQSYSKGEDLTSGERFEKMLFGAYYAECEASKSSFLKAWSTTDRNIRNVAAAVIARGRDITIDSVVVGEDDIVEQLTSSSAADFGLRGELSYLDAIIAAINDEGNMVEKEHKIDLIRWGEASEMSEFDYFNLNTILAYLVKINIVARWSALDAARGREMFNSLIKELGAKEKINNK